MRKLYQFLTVIFFVTLTPVAMAGVIVLEGNYMGKNIYVKNPNRGAGVGFCVSEVTINGRLSPDEVNQDAFEIDFENFDLKIGDKVVINIKHGDDCKPKVLNPEVLKPKSTFKVKDISFDKNGILNWTTENENGKLDYILEQFRWNKWVKVGEVEGIGTPGVNAYSFKLSPHSGLNKVRVKQVDYTGKPNYSKPAEYTSNKPEITIDGDRFKDEIEFQGGETRYELYDKYGTIVKRGYGKSVDISNFDKGTYYLSFDNKTKTITIR